jgi:glycerol-3-phosphate acyltransferase PlsY
MIHEAWMQFGVFPLAGYLVGSIPFGVILARLHGVNLRQVGSGNVGATNVARALGRKWGYLCFFLDLLKGLAPVLAAGWLLHAFGEVPTVPQQWAWLAFGGGAIAGHVFPIWLKFRGGKGVATSLGVVLGVWPFFTLPGLVSLAIWIALVLLFRFVSLASIMAAAAFVPVFVLIQRERTARLWPLVVFASLVVALIIFRHRTNIVRLLRGSENRVGQNPSRPPDGEESLPR